MKVSKQQIAEFRQQLENAMRALNEGGWGIPEAQLKAECYETSDEHIASIIKDGSTPEKWAEFITQ